MTGIRSRPTCSAQFFNPFFLTSCAANPIATAKPTKGIGLIRRLANFHPPARAILEIGRIHSLQMFTFGFLPAPSVAH